MVFSDFCSVRSALRTRLQKLWCRFRTSQRKERDLNYIGMNCLLLRQLNTEYWTVLNIRWITYLLFVFFHLLFRRSVFKDKHSIWRFQYINECLLVKLDYCSLRFYYWTINSEFKQMDNRGKWFFSTNKATQVQKRYLSKL